MSLAHPQVLALVIPAYAMLLELHHSLHMPGVRTSQVMTDCESTGAEVESAKQPRWLVGDGGAAEDADDDVVEGDGDGDGEGEGVIDAEEEVDDETA